MSIADVLEGRARWCVVEGDCIDVLPTIGRVDAIVTDPPYGVGLVTKTSDYRDSANFDNGASLRASTLYDDDPSTIRSLIGTVMPMILRASDVSLVFPGTAMLWAYPEPACVGCVFIPSGAGRASWGFQCMQPILFYGRDPYLASGKGGRPNSFRTEQPNREKLDHPCPKPIDWMLWAVSRASTSSDDVILDPFAGTGTTGVAALRLGKRTILIEKEAKYAEIARERLAAEESNSTLQAKRAGQGALFG